MNFEIMTLFPELVDTVLSSSIIGRARSRGALSVGVHNIRDYSADKHRRVDDTPYGGGMGMLMSAPPIYSCYRAIVDREDFSGRTRVVYMSPKGSLLNQKEAYRLAEYDNLIILCGHYEGIDQRIIDEIVDEEISIGDYVLTGGELPACILVDCVGRLADGVLSSPECHELESFSCGLLEFPQYTRPYDFLGRKVPDVLLSGNHAEIARWRQEQALALTRTRRPDLLGRNDNCNNERNNERNAGLHENRQKAALARGAAAKSAIADENSSDGENYDVPSLEGGDSSEKRADSDSHKAPEN